LSISDGRHGRSGDSTIAGSITRTTPFYSRSSSPGAALQDGDGDPYGVVGGPTVHNDALIAEGDAVQAIGDVARFILGDDDGGELGRREGELVVALVGLLFVARTTPEVGAAGVRLKRPNPRPALMRGAGQEVVVIARIERGGYANLPEVAEALGRGRFRFGLLNAGRSIPARIAMMAITTRSSINVKAWERCGAALRFVRAE
jgi:hypothetical protein